MATSDFGSVYTDPSGVNQERYNLQGNRKAPVTSARSIGQWVVKRTSVYGAQRQMELNYPAHVGGEANIDLMVELGNLRRPPPYSN
jgi:hypothetical protein